MTKKRTPKSQKRTRQASNVRRLQRLITPFFYWRYHEDDDVSPLVTHRSYRGPTTPVTMDEIEYQVQHTPFKWQCVTITYCRDSWGKEYRVFGFGETQTQMKVVEDPIEPLLTASLEHAESSVNPKHIYARGAVMAPKSRNCPDILPSIAKVRSGLHLTRADVQDIQDYLDTPAESYQAELKDTDTQLAELLNT